MKTEQLPLAVAILLGLPFIAIGGLNLFFADHICDWLIRHYQSRRTRVMHRILGTVVIIVGIAVE